MRKRILLLLVVYCSILFTQVPNSPILVEPPKEASVVSLTPLLVWDAVPGVDCYFIYVTVDTAISPPPAFCMVTEPSYQVPASTLSPDVVYYWTVKAHNSSGWGNFSPFFSFRTASTTVIGSINNLGNQVNSLYSRGDIPANQANILNNRLDQAVHHIELDNEFVAILNLLQFKFRVNILRASDMLTDDEANSLNYSADGVIDLIQTVSPQGIASKDIEPVREFSLKQNYPNPFNPIATIEYSIPDNSLVTIKVYDLMGKEIATLVNKYQEYGSYIASWNATNFSSGIYIYRLTAGKYSLSKKMILNK